MSLGDRPIAVTMGDPAGCGPSITRAAWQARKDRAVGTFYVVAAPELYSGTGPICEIHSPSEAPAAFASGLPILPLKTTLPNIMPGAANPATAAAILESIEVATSQALAGVAGAVVTNPISKALLYESGFRHPGHTEFIAELCARKDRRALRPVMMLVGGGLRVSLATIHIPLKDVSQSLSHDMLAEIGDITARALRDKFGIPNPRLVFSGLNPHAGESGSIGQEEVEIINPAAATLRAQGIDIADSRPADTVFHEARSGRFDAVIAMTHDQGLIPVKTLDMWGGVNTTLGLPIIRTSPDHGTAYEATAAGTARADSLIAALDLAEAMAHNRVKANV